MKTSITAFLSGLIFAAGLGISGMTDPRKVLGFLNVRSGWDPSLMFAMASALLVTGVTYFLVRKRSRPVFEKHWDLPTKTEITVPLISGSMLFGLGWGLVGYCPGPAFVSLMSFRVDVLLFCGSMFAGMFLYRVYESCKHPRQ